MALSDVLYAAYARRLLREQDKLALGLELAIAEYG